MARSISLQRLVLSAAAVALSTCAGPNPKVATGGAVTGAEPTGVAIGDLDKSADPCADFFQFANGTWRAQNPIPAAKPRWSRRVAAHDANIVRVQKLLEDIAKRTDWPKGSGEQQIGDHFASCLDETRVDTAGIAPLVPLLAEIDGAGDRGDLQRIIRRLHELGVPAAFGTLGAMDYHEPSRFILNITAGSLGLGDRKSYLDPALEDARAKYRSHVGRILVLGGMAEPQAREAAGEIFGLEKRLAEAALDPGVAADPAATDHKLSFSALEKLAPHVEWSVYFAEAHLPRVDLNVAEPRFLQQVDRELSEAPVAVWKLYFRFQLLESAAPWLSAPFVAEAAPGSTPRAQRCAELTETLFGDAVGKAYVERYFPPVAQAKVEAIVANLRAVLEDAIASATWMAPATKAIAQRKLAAMDIQLGRPARWRPAEGVTVRRASFWANVAAARKYKVAEDRKLVGKPTDRTFWQLPASSANAYLDFQLDQLVLPAGFLQPPYFDADASDAMNYGGFGGGLAHDMTHHLDTAGAEVDELGRPAPWWTPADTAEFAKRRQCMSDEADAYTIEPGVHLEGKRVLGEAVADLAGVRIAYAALQRSMASRPVPTIGGFTPEQQFFISWGQVNGAAMRIEAQRELARSDPHPVPRFRVNSPLASSPDFQKAFACKPGTPMARPPAQLCSVW